MAAEPEKKIEELLQSYSRKRREDAGAPLEMHPATRRMLQGEVAREHGKHGGASPRPWWKALLLFGPKYAGALGMFAILALGVWVVTQQEHQSTSVREEASDRRAGANADRARPLGELAQREGEKLNEVDDRARVPSPSKEAENKNVELSKAGRGFREQEKVQTRDADGSPVTTVATPTPAPPQVKLTEELMREKQVPLQNEPQVGQRIANVVAGGAGVSADKGSTALADKPGAPEERFYKRSEAKADALGVPAPAMQPITARLDLAAAQAAVTNHYAFAVAPVTNVALGAEAATALYAGVELAAATTNARGEKLLAFGGAATPSATEWAAVPAEQPVKNEIDRTRELKVLSRVAQDAESREGVSPALLRRFSVEQNNGTIRIRDAEDGSVYVGEMLALSEPNLDGKTKAAKDEFRQNAEEVRSGGVTFRARGVNQRSKQVVIIDGELTEEQDRLGEVVGKSVAGVSGATAPRPAPTSPAPTSTPARPADARSLGRRDQVAGADGQPQGQARTAVRSTPAPALATSTSASAASTSAVFRATTLRARVQIGATNELNFRAIRTR